MRQPAGDRRANSRPRCSTAGFNILDAQQFDEVETGNFSCAVVFNLAPEANLEELREAFKAIAMAFAMTWSMRPKIG